MLSPMIDSETIGETKVTVVHRMVDHLHAAHWVDADWQIGRMLSPIIDSETIGETKVTVVHRMVDHLHADWQTGRMLSPIIDSETIGETKVTVVHRMVDHLNAAREIALRQTDNDIEDPFFVVNLDMIVEQYQQWNRQLPDVKAFYAVKCNNDPVILRVLGDLGVAFDCASKSEIDQVLNTTMVQPENIIFANPCKVSSHITHAAKRGVHKMTFDSIEELKKMHKLDNEAQGVLRIAVSDPTAICQLNVKFGCEPELAPSLLQEASRLNLSVIGISFHVGSGSNDPTAFKLAIAHARRLMDIGRSMGHSMGLLDIGGGFPGNDNDKFAMMASAIRTSLTECFTDEERARIRVIGEPGRFFAAASSTLVPNVISKIRVPKRRLIGTAHDDDDNQDEGFMIFINDGVYGSFNCKFYDHVHPRGFPLLPALDDNQKKWATTIWGPTCDGLDQVEELSFMREVDVGEWLCYPNMGAYTSAAASEFNGFPRPKSFYFIGQHCRDILRQAGDDRNSG